jgi:uncharacterized protein
MPDEAIARSARLRSPAAPLPILVPAAVVAVALVTWVVTVDRMQGMDAGPGTGLGGLGWFVGVWATMMAAMMLPSLLPTALVVARASAVYRTSGRSFADTWMPASRGSLSPAAPGRCPRCPRWAARAGTAVRARRDGGCAVPIGGIDSSTRTRRPMGPSTQRTGESMPHPVIHAEIRSQDPDATRAFLAAPFDWQVASEGGFPGHTFMDTGAAGGPAVAVSPRQGTDDEVLFFVAVDDVAATLAKAEELGGTIIQPAQQVPGVSFGVLADSHGHRIGVAAN